MQSTNVIININGQELDCVVAYIPAVSAPAITHLAPENCCESEDMQLLALSYDNLDLEPLLDIDFVAEDIKKQINGEYE